MQLRRKKCISVVGDGKPNKGDVGHRKDCKRVGISDVQNDQVCKVYLWDVFKGGCIKLKHVKLMTT